MKKRELNELKNKSIGQLKKSVAELEKAMVEAKLDQKQGKAKNVHLFRDRKKDIAKVLTILRIKEFIQKEAPGGTK